jgi:hypothetical protein
MAEAEIELSVSHQSLELNQEEIGLLSIMLHPH